MKKTLTYFLTAVSIVSTVSFVMARGGGDHGGGDKGDRGYETGGTHQTWCDVNPSCNGWASVMAIAYPTRYSAAASAQASVRPIVVAQHKPVPVHVAAPIKKQQDHLPAYAFLFE